MIIGKNIWFSYEKSKYVLKNINFEADLGLTVIVGPNGSGKTTLLKILAGLYKPVRGNVYVDGKPLYNKHGEGDLQIRRNITYVHEKPIILKGTVFDNIIYGLSIRKQDNINKNYIKNFIDKFGLSNLINKRAVDLSMGQQQIVSIARALIIKPKYLLLDEPLQNLDEVNRDLIWDIIKKYAYNNCVIVATHDRSLIREADKIVYMSEGKVAGIKVREISKDYL